MCVINVFAHKEICFCFIFFTGCTLVYYMKSSCFLFVFFVVVFPKPIVNSAFGALRTFPYYKQYCNEYSWIYIFVYLSDYFFELISQEWNPGSRRILPYFHVTVQEKALDRYSLAPRVPASMCFLIFTEILTVVILVAKNAFI